jgi:hypothetical protein
MSLEAIHLQAQGPLAATSVPQKARPASGRSAPEETGAAGGFDQVVVSDQARSLAARLDGKQGPELQLSPEKLRELVNGPSDPFAPA